MTASTSAPSAPSAPSPSHAPLASMTGFGRAEVLIDGIPLVVEMKGVNARYAEIKIRLPSTFAELEWSLRQKIQQSIARGRVDVSIRLGAFGDIVTEPLLNLPTAKRYTSLAKEMAESLGLPPADLPIPLLFQLPGVITQTPIQIRDELLQASLDQALSSALQSFVSMRIFEGEHLRADLLGRLGQIRDLAATIEERAPIWSQVAFQRLQERVQGLLSSDLLDPARLHQEAALLAERADISEEITRLQSHLKQFTSMLEKGGPVGRKLDFLCQELHREANTIGSKSQDLVISQALLSIKSEIEKIREQVQNLE